MKLKELLLQNSQTKQEIHLIEKISTISFDVVLNDKITLQDAIILLRAIRWLNVLFLAITQYLTAICIFNKDQSILAVLSDYKLHIIVVATAFSVAGAFLINGFYDVEKDTVNRPQGVIFNRLLSTDILLNTYAFVSGLSVFIALFAGVKIFIFFTCMVGIYWLYSHKLSVIPFIRELSASLLTILCFVSVWLHYGAFIEHAHWPFFVYLLAILTVLFSREIIKDLKGQQGNAIFGYKTVVETTGPRLALRGLLIFSALALVLAIVGIYMMKITPGYFSLISLFGFLVNVPCEDMLYILFFSLCLITCTPLNFSLISSDFFFVSWAKSTYLSFFLNSSIR